ncbi:MAG: YkgJ family cysteine cluster protein [Candidatus Thermoplasmatota archaeon]|nr:YkgJ family cysteine cluster protein [Candidatus Thermoplasmatota archaeon]
MKERSFETHDRADEKGLVSREWAPFQPGTRWKCIRCAGCCRQPWAINLTWWEFERLTNDDRASGIDIDRIELDTRTGLTHPYFLIKEKCPALDAGTFLCTLFPDWPYTCATYPFLLAPGGELMVHTECQGIGQGPVLDIDEMKRKIISEREKAGMIVN